MSEQRFEFKLKVNFIDEETGEEIYHKVLIDNSNGNEIGFDDMVGLLNEMSERIDEQQATIEYLKKRLYDFEKRKIIEESEIDEDVIPKVKLLRTELFGEKYE